MIKAGGRTKHTKDEKQNEQKKGANNFRDALYHAQPAKPDQKGAS